MELLKHVANYHCKDKSDNNEEKEIKDSGEIFFEKEHIVGEAKVDEDDVFCVLEDPVGQIHLPARGVTPT